MCACARFDFATLHRYLDWAEARQARVLLTVGLKAQRHPEYYPPAWLLGEGSPAHHGRVANQPRMLAHLLLMLERTVALLADYSCIEAWQVENEPFVPAAARTLGWRFDVQTLRKEIGAVRASDPRSRPIVVTHASSTVLGRGWRTALRFGNVLGQDVYTRKPVPGRRLSYANPFALGPLGPNLPLQATVARLAGRGLWITELQAEPWENVPMPELTDEEIGSISPKQIESNLALARRARPERIYFWGAEWWAARKQAGDARYWDLARRLFEAE
ncbi:MAG: hypothetical protein ACYDCQ_01515 [Dehalococcoidia bacterium]